MTSLNSYNVKGLAYIGIFLVTAIYMEINIVMMMLVALKALTIELAEIILNFGGTLLLNALDLGKFSHSRSILDFWLDQSDSQSVCGKLEKWLCWPYFVGLDILYRNNISVCEKRNGKDFEQSIQSMLGSMLSHMQILL